MWGSDVYRSSADNDSPPAELTGVLRSTVLHFAAPRIASDVVPPIGTVLGIKPHPGRIDESEFHTDKLLWLIPYGDSATCNTFSRKARMSAYVSICFVVGVPAP